MDSWIAFWSAELTEPPAHPVYTALFLAFIVSATVATYTYRGLPHWVIESHQSRFLRWSSVSIALLSLTGAAISVLQTMSVPIVSRRIWLALVICALLVQCGSLFLVGSMAMRRSRHGDGHNSSTER